MYSDLFKPEAPFVAINPAPVVCVGDPVVVPLWVNGSVVGHVDGTVVEVNDFGQRDASVIVSHAYGETLYLPHSVTRA